MLYVRVSLPLVLIIQISLKETRMSKSSIVIVINLFVEHDLNSAWNKD